jgi:hypothetical protein
MLGNGPLINHGGPVQTSPHVYVDYWGWTSDPAGEKGYLSNFLSSVGNTPWTKVLGQYGSGTNPVLTAQWTDTKRTPGASPTAGAIGKEAAVAAAHFGIAVSPATVNDQIIVALPTGTSFTIAGPGACAWHSDLTLTSGTNSSPISYTALPYLPDPGPCNGGWVNAGYLFRSPDPTIAHLGERRA